MLSGNKRNGINITGDVTGRMQQIEVHLANIGAVAAVTITVSPIIVIVEGNSWHRLRDWRKAKEVAALDSLVFDPAAWFSRTVMAQKTNLSDRAWDTGNIVASD
jgi:hypothetical protein